MEVSALRYSGGIGIHARSPLLRLQSDERLIALTRRGNQSAFEVLVSRYQARLLAFCRHLLGSREDAEDVLQEVFAAAFNAMVADERPINVKPWLYRIARNRSLNHLRRAQPIGVDSMDVHFSENGASTADKVHDREQFRLLIGDIQQLPETQRTALILREMDALSYEQIAEAMDTTVPGVKSLLVRARISLAEAAEARQLSCADVRIELAEVAEGLRRRATPLVRRHLRGCQRCSGFEKQLKETNKALAALLPLGPLVLLKKLLLTHLGGSAGTSSGAAGATGAVSGSSGAAAGGAATAAGTTAAVSSTGALSAGAGALATKAAAGIAAALVTVGAVAATHHSHPRAHRLVAAAALPASHVVSPQSAAAAIGRAKAASRSRLSVAHHHRKLSHARKSKRIHAKPTALGSPSVPVKAKLPARHVKAQPPARTVTQNDPTVLSTPAGGKSHRQSGGPIGPPPGDGGSSSGGGGGSSSQNGSSPGTTTGSSSTTTSQTATSSDTTQTATAAG